MAATAAATTLLQLAIGDDAASATGTGIGTLVPNVVALNVLSEKAPPGDWIVFHLFDQLKKHNLVNHFIVREDARAKVLTLFGLPALPTEAKKKWGVKRLVRFAGSDETGEIVFSARLNGSLFLTITCVLLAKLFQAAGFQVGKLASPLSLYVRVDPTGKATLLRATIVLALVGSSPPPAAPPPDKSAVSAAVIERDQRAVEGAKRKAKALEASGC